MRHIFEINNVERFRDALFDLGGREFPLLTQAHRDVLADGERVEEGGELEHVADLGAQLHEVASRERIHAHVVDPHFAAVGLEQTHNVLDRHRLARARITDDDHRLAFLHVEREALEDFLLAEGLVDVLELDHGTVTVVSRGISRICRRGCGVASGTACTRARCARSVRTNKRPPPRMRRGARPCGAAGYAAKLPSARPTSPSRRRLSARSRS